MEIIGKIKDTLTKDFIEFLYLMCYCEEGTFADAVHRFNQLEYISYVTKTNLGVHAVANIHNYREYSKYIQENLCDYLQNHPGSVLSISDIQAVYTHDILRELNNAF